MNTAKAIKDLSFKSRFLPSYGANEALFQQCVDYIRYWQDKLFIIDEQSFEDQVNTDQLKIRQIESADPITAQKVPQMDADDVRKEEQLSFLRLNSSITLGIDDNQYALPFESEVDLNQFSRRGSVINTGGTVTSLKWLHGTKDNKQYLALTIINDASGDDLNSLIGNDQLSIFHTVPPSASEEGLIRTAIQIWQLDVESGKLSLYKILNTTRFGACGNISWVPLRFDSSIGVLSGSFKDGRLHFFRIDANRNGCECLDVKSLSFSYGLHNPRAENEVLAITTYDFLLNDRVIVGFTDGSIAEFILPNFHNTKTNDNSEMDLSVPSFIHNLAETPISSVTVGDPVKGKYIIQVNTFGLQNIIFDYDNYMSQRVNSFGSSLKPVYHEQLEVFICLDSYDVAAYTFARHPHERQSLLLKTDGVITAYGVSTVLNHPMVLVAGSYGELFIVNIARKILSPSKTANKTLAPLRLWKLCYNDNSNRKGLSLHLGLEPVQPDKTNKVTVSPDQVNISCLGWNENVVGCSMYAAGTHCGLLFIEKLDPNVKN